MRYTLARRVTVLVFLALMAFSAAACTDAAEEPGDITQFETPTGVPGTGTPSSNPNADDPQAETTLQLVAQNTSFDTAELTAPAGTSVTLEFTNQDPVTHNVTIYSPGSEEQPIFTSDVFSGPDVTREYQFTTPEQPGEYLFHCSVHPTQMTGTFNVD